jgi:putative glycosyltransferase (TIGR04372 family)
MLPGRKRHEVQWPSDLDTNSSLYRARTHLFFTPDEERAGRRALEDLGIRDGEPFVCFHVRDDSYLNALIRNEWSYHNYRDSSIDNIIPAVIELARRGYFAVRMGSVCKEGLAAGGDRIIDYAKRGRTDFLDVYLPSRCRFFLGTTAGIISVAAIFRRPIAFCNSIPLEYMINCGVEGVFIPKKLWLRKEKRFMTLDEILRSGAGRFIHSEGYEKMGIEVIENSPEEITALVAEMDERLNDRWRSCEEDGGLYAKFLAVCRPYLRRREIVPRIGTDFLRKNREFVER